VDLGVNVPAPEIIDSAEEVGADLIGVSALLTTTVIAQKDLIELLEKRGLREDIKIIIGGAASSKN